MPDQIGHAQRVGGDPKDVAASHAVDVAPKLLRGRRDPRALQSQQLRAGHLLTVIPLASLVSELAHGKPLEKQLGVHQACMDPQEEFGVLGVVGEAGDLVDPVHILMDQVDAPSGLEGFLVGPEGDLVGHLKRSLQPLPGVALVEARLPRSRQHERMGRLHEQGPGTAEQHGGLPVHLPRHRLGTEQPRIFRRQFHRSTVRETERRVPRTTARTVQLSGWTTLHRQRRWGRPD
jgi:hypothetical protein